MTFHNMRKAFSSHCSAWRIKHGAHLLAYGVACCVCVAYGGLWRRKNGRVGSLFSDRGDFHSGTSLTKPPADYRGCVCAIALRWRAAILVTAQQRARLARVTYFSRCASSATHGAAGVSGLFNA